MPILILLLDSIIVGVFFLSIFVLPSFLRGLFRNKEEYNTVWKRFFNEGRPFTIGGAILFIWGLLGVIGVLLNYSFDKQHGIPTYYTDATLIYSYLPSLITAIIGLINWTYFKSLRKKKQEAVVAEPIEEEIPKKASHVVSVKVRKSPDNATISEPIPPVASKVTTASAKTRYCKFCGGQIDPLTKQCSSCGKQFFHLSKPKILLSLVAILIIIGLGSIFGFKAYTNSLNDEILSNAMDSLYNQQYSLALSYFDQLPAPDVNYPNEYAFAKAGVLYEEGDLLGAYNAYYSLENPPSYNSFIKKINVQMYREAVKAYRIGKYEFAKDYFSAIKEFSNSSDYLFLISCRETKENSYWTLSTINKVISLASFEDTAEIILENNPILYQFLVSKWDDRKTYPYYFELEKDGLNYSSRYNLPSDNKTGTFTIDNGVYYVNGDPLFKFTILSEHSISVYCYENRSIHTLYREGRGAYLVG